MKRRPVAGGNLPLPIQARKEAEILFLTVVPLLKAGAYTQSKGFQLIHALTAVRTVLSPEDPASGEFMLGIFQTLNNIKARATASGKWGATGDEIRLLEERLPVCAECYASLTRAELEIANRDFSLRMQRVLKEVK